MVTNYKIIIQFDGTRYSGWQYQAPPIKSVQGELFRALQIIAKKRIVITGSSRTDSGVHSIGLTANFHLPIKIAPESLQKALNALLPEDIRINDCITVDKSFNARFNAIGKVYIYKLFFGQVLSPFECRYATHFPFPLNLPNMRKSLKYFVGQNDFSSFTSDSPDKKRIREVESFTMKVKGEMITFTVTGRSFLRYMVRNIVGTVIDVGRGKIKAEDIPGIFAAQDRRKGGQTAPPRGLILAEVKYPPFLPHTDSHTDSDREPTHPTDLTNPPCTPPDMTIDLDNDE